MGKRDIKHINLVGGGGTVPAKSKKRTTAKAKSRGARPKVAQTKSRDRVRSSR